MDLRQLEYVVAVAEEASFTKAASRCHVVQSALSAQVARLEHELGLRLFERTSRSVRLAPAGELLLPHARALLRDAEVARAELAAFAGVVTGRLRLGSIGVAVGGLPLLQETLMAFHQRHPGVEIRVQDTGSRHMAEQVRTGELDLAFVALYADQVSADLTHRLLADEPLVVVVPGAHPLADRSAVRLEELAGHGPFVEMPPIFGLRLQVDKAFERAGVNRDIAFELGSPDAVVRFVGLGLGVALVPASTALDAPDVAILTLEDCAAGHPVGLVHRSPAPATPSARAFMALLLQAHHEASHNPQGP